MCNNPNPCTSCWKLCNEFQPDHLMLTNPLLKLLFFLFEYIRVTQTHYQIFSYPDTILYQKVIYHEQYKYFQTLLFCKLNFSFLLSTLYRIFEKKEYR